MIRCLIIGLMLLLLSAGLGLSLVSDPGYAVFYYHHWTVTMPFWVAVVGLIILFCLLQAVIKATHTVHAQLKKISHILPVRQYNKQLKNTRDGVLKLLAQDWMEASALLQCGVKQGEWAVINYSALAKVAHEQQQFAQCEDYLKAALRAAPETDVALGLMHAQLQLQQGNPHAALATLNTLRCRVPKQTAILSLLEKIYEQMGHWQELIALLPQLSRVYGWIKVEKINFENRTYVKWLQHVATQPDAAVALDVVWQNIPRSRRASASVLHAYAQALYSNSVSATEVAQLLTAFLQHQWDDALMDLYGQLRTPSLGQQLALAEAWYKKIGDNGILLLALARLSTRSKLWGKALFYYERVLGFNKFPLLYLEYAELLAQQGRTLEAARHCYVGLLQALNRSQAEKIIFE